MTVGSRNDPFEIPDDASDHSTEAEDHNRSGNGKTFLSSAASTSRIAASQRPAEPSSSSSSPSVLPARSPQPAEIADTSPRAQQSTAARVLPPGFALRAKTNGSSSKGTHAASASPSAQTSSHSSNGTAFASSSKSSSSRVWNPPPRPWEKEARARALETINTLQQPDHQIPTVSGSAARMPNNLINSHQQHSSVQQNGAIDLTNDDGSDDDEPRIVSYKRGDIELDEQRNNGPVCVGVIQAIVLCINGLPQPVASVSPAVHDPAQDDDPVWDRAHWPGASRWFMQPGHRPLVVKVKYPVGHNSMAAQQTAGQWSYGGVRPMQRTKPELAVSVVLSPRAHVEKQLHEGVRPQRLSHAPFYKAPFGTLADKFVDSLEPLLSRGIIHCEARCRMVSPARAGHFLHSIEMLLFCIRPNVSVVSEQLSKHGIVLEPPRPDQFDSNDYSGSPPLVNPHGVSQSQQGRELANRYAFTSSMYTPGLGGRMVQSKEMTEEEKKKQIELVYDELVSGEDLPLAKPSPLIKTQLFPHQLKAISFLLEREKARSFADAQDTAKSQSKEDAKSADNAVSLWNVIRSRVDGSIRTFHNVVTQHQQSEEPEICRGAILADDMGLGKTITVIATIAATLQEAKEFRRGKVDKGNADDHQSHDDDDTAEEEEQHSLTDLASGLQAVSSKKVRNGTSAVPKSSQRSKGKGKQKQIGLEAMRRKHLVTKSKATLIVCPLTIVSNWEDQIKEHWDPSCQPSIYVYHGPSRSSSPQFVASHDIVLTTYATLASEFANQHTWIVHDERKDEESDDDDEFEVVDANGDPVNKKRGKKRKRHTGKEAPNTLQRIEWFRVVLDEAHTIKEARTMQCKAVCNLSAQRRLSLTGTPVQNRLDDLFAQVRFLRLYPFTERSVWNEHCGQRRTKNSITSRSNANQNNEPLEQMALVKVQTIMKFLTLRRTKNSKTADGRPLLELPPKATHLITLQFDEREQAAYKALHQKYKEDFEEMQAAGSIGTNYATILQEILVLRMCCDHSGLVDASKDMKRLREGDADIGKAITEDGLTRARAARLFDIFAESLMADCVSCGTDLSRLAEDSNSHGAGAIDEGEEGSKLRPVVTRCQHFFCSTCFGRAAGPKWLRPKSITAEDKVFCPACNVELGLLMDAIKLEPGDIASIRSAHQSPPSEEQTGAVDDFDWGSDDDEHKAAAEDKSTLGKRRSTHNVEFGADRDIPVEDRDGLSSKIRFLLNDLLPYSMCNPKSLLYDAGAKQLSHYAPSEEEKASSGLPDSVCIAETQENPQTYRPVKSVVFSQWTSMLDQVSSALYKAGIRAVRLDGKMRRNERAAALDAFKTDDGVEVFLISLRAGGFGLNLVNACRAYNIEPAWNPAVESQAMDRIHRLGQVRPVLVKKLVVKNSIEERMLDVQKRKEELANQVGEKRGKSKADERAERHQELSMLLSGDGSVGVGGSSSSNGSGGSGGGRGSGPHGQTSRPIPE